MTYGLAGIVNPSVSPEIVAESPFALPATSVWVMEMLPGRVEFVTLAESLPLHRCHGHHSVALNDDDVGRASAK